jgi:hypothetical protein
MFVDVNKRTKENQQFKWFTHKYHGKLQISYQDMEGKSKSKKLEEKIKPAEVVIQNILRRKVVRDKCWKKGKLSNRLIPFHWKG